MNWLRHHTSECEQLDTIIHLGAGSCSELSIYQSLTPRQIVLVEPNPEQVEILQERARAIENVQVMEYAVSGIDGGGPLQVLSDPCFSSLKEPVALLELLPGLNVERQITPKIASITELIDSLELDGAKQHCLFIDTPGTEGELLSAISQTGDLELFSHVFLRSGIESFYSGSIPTKVLCAELSATGYRSMGAPDVSDSDFPVFHFHIDHLFIENQRLVETIEKLKASHEEKLVRLQATLSEKEQQIKALSTQIRAKETVLNDSSEAYQSAIEGLQGSCAEKEQHIEALSTQIQAKDTALNDSTQAHQSAIEQSQATLTEKEQQIESLSAQIQAKDTALNDSAQAHQSAIEQSQATLTEKEQQIESLSAQIQAKDSALNDITQAHQSANEQFQSEIEKKDGELSIALKLQMLRESDLEDLQQRYSENMDLKNRQTELLKSMKERLSEAAIYLRQLNADDDPIIENDVTAKLLDAISGTSDQ